MTASLASGMTAPAGTSASQKVTRPFARAGASSPKGVSLASADASDSSKGIASSASVSMSRWRTSLLGTQKRHW